MDMKLGGKSNVKMKGKKVKQKVKREGNRIILMRDEKRKNGNIRTKYKWKRNVKEWRWMKNEKRQGKIFLKEEQNERQNRRIKGNEIKFLEKKDHQKRKIKGRKRKKERER